MRPGDVRQWRFRTTGTQVRAGAPVTVHNDAVGLDLALGPLRLPLGPPVPGAGADADADRLARAAGLSLSAPPATTAAVTLGRAGSSDRPICGGEQVAVQLRGVGYLAAGQPGGAQLVVHTEPAAEWVVTGVAPGVAVPVGLPVALFDTVQGDHLVCYPGPDQPVLDWAAGAGGHPAATRLPIPDAFRPPEGVPGDVELAGALVPVRDGDLSAGLLLLLDPADGRTLGAHLTARAPEQAAQLAPEGVVGAVACRWSAAGAPSPAGPALPPAGSRLWVHGLLVADPGVCLTPVRALAWALDADGEPVDAAPGEPGWPRTAITWWMVLPALPDDVPGGLESWVCYLPLPGQDGEPGSTTTLTPLSAPDLAGGCPPQRRIGGRRAATLVPGVRGPARMLRMAATEDRGGRPVTSGCTVRVHLPDPRPAGT